MSNTTLRAVQITLREFLSSAPTWGLYTSGIYMKSYFRWIEAAMTGCTAGYKEGILLKSGISPIKETADLRNGGNIAQLQGVTIRIDHTSRIWTFIRDQGINLNGCKVEVFEFEKDKDTDVVTETRIFYGEINLDSWSETTYTLPAVPLQYKRNAQQLTIVDATNYPDAQDDAIGKPIPATFGNFNDDNFFARFMRVAGKVTDYETASGNNVVNDAGDYFVVTDSPKKLFTPILIGPGAAPVVDYDIFISEETVHWYNSSGVEYTSGQIPIEVWEGSFVGVVDGDQAGNYRKILDAYCDLDDLGNTQGLYVHITLADYFPENLNQSDTSYLIIKDIPFEYKADVWPCKGYYDTTDTIIPQLDQIYLYADKKKTAATVLSLTDTIVKSSPLDYVKLPRYIFITKEASTDYNTITLGLGLFDGDTDNIVGYEAFPIVSPQLSPLSASLFNNQWVLGLTSPVKISDGFYYTGSAPTLLETFGTPARLNDRDSGAAPFGIRFSIPTGAVVVLGVEFKMPPFPSFEFDKVYIGVQANITGDFIDDRWISVKTRRFWKVGDNVLERSVFDNTKHYDDYFYGNIPRQYWNPEITGGGNKDFFFNGEAYVDGSSVASTGMAIFEVPNVDTRDKYNNIIQGAFIWTFSASPNPETSVYFLADEICVIFAKSFPLGKAIYSPFAGRVYNDTWGGRKTPTNLIDNLRDVYEHTCRLQNWSEVGATEQPGKAYGTGALINTTNIDGSDNGYLLNMLVGFQLSQDRDGWTETFKRECARAGFFVGYVDEEGKECIATLRSISESIVDYITLANVPEDETIGDVQEPDVKNIYCEPLVRYQFNAATEGYNKIVAITNIDKSTWLPAYTPGLTPVTGATLWLACKALYTKYQHIEQPPKELTDQRMFYDDTTAAAYLTYWIQWMDKRRITVPISYDTVSFTAAKTWHVGKHIYLNLPHQTDGLNVECVIEGITKDKAAGVITLDLIMF